MATKPSGKEKVVGSVRRSTRKVVKETITVAVVEGGDTQDSTQEEEELNIGETEELIDRVLTEEPVRIIPVREEDEMEVEDRSFEVSLGVPTREVPIDGGSVQGEKGGEGKDHEEMENKEEETSGVSQEEERLIRAEEPKRDTLAESGTRGPEDWEEARIEEEPKRDTFTDSTTQEAEEEAAGETTPQKVLLKMPKGNRSSIKIRKKVGRKSGAPE